MTLNASSTARSAIARRRVLPVVTASDEAALCTSLEALSGGGLPLIELTLRTPYALTAIAEARRHAEFVVGAGSIRSVSDARAAVDAGAQFLVSPGFDPDVASWSKEHGVELFPGAVTPTETLAARRAGFDTLKFFPASVFGGPDWLKAVSAPISDVSFIPTGGIGDSTFEDYLRTPGVCAVGGSWFLHTTDDPREGSRRVAEVVARASAIEAETSAA